MSYNPESQGGYDYGFGGGGDNYNNHENYGNGGQYNYNNAGRGSGNGRGRGRGRGGYTPNTSYSAPEPVQTVRDEDIDTIYVAGLPKDITDASLIEFFGSIGLIKKKKKDKRSRIKTECVWIYKDKASGLPKGDATVTYEDPQTAQAAVKWFNGVDFKKQGKIDVSLSTWQKTKTAPPGGYPTSNSRGGGRGGGRGGRGGRGGGDAGGYHPSNPAPGDWQCPGCNNMNWARRNQCNRCKGQKPGGQEMPDNRENHRGQNDRENSSYGGRENRGREDDRDSRRSGGRDNRDNRDYGNRDDRNNRDYGSRDERRNRDRDDRDRRERRRSRSRSPRRR